MPNTFYLDYEGGNDGNDGTSFAQRWKTFTNGATAARIAPGDAIRVMASPSPTSLSQNATWTENSATVTLTTAVTTTITLCDSAWSTPDAVNVTVSQSTTRKEGTKSQSVAIGANFNTGNAAYFATGTLNLSNPARQQVSFWIRNSAGAAVAAGDLSLRLCTGNNGTGSVHTIPIPALFANVWTAVTVDLGADMNSAIASVALYVDTDKGATTVLIDNIIACNDDTAANSLTLQSLISKNTTGSTWHAIKSINGTTIVLDANPASAQGAGQGFGGATDTVPIWKRETIKTAEAASTTTAVQTVMDSGTLAGGAITFSGGWNRTDMSSQTAGDQTWFDGHTGWGYGIYISSQNFVTLSDIGLVRYYYGLYCATNTNITLTNVSANSCGGVGLYCETSNSLLVMTNCAACHNGSYGFNAAIAYNAAISGLMTDSNAGSAGVYLGAAGVLCSGRMSNLISRSNTNYGLSNASLGKWVIDTVATKNNGTGGISTSSLGDMLLVGATIPETAEAAIAVAGNYINARVVSENHDSAGAHRIWTDGGLIQSDTTNRHTASGICWQICPTSTNRQANYPLDFVLATIAVNANVDTTITAWMYRDNAGLTGRLVCRGGQIAGVNETYHEVSGTGAYEQRTITIHPTASGVVQIEAWAWGGTTYSLYVDDLTITGG